VIQRRVAEPEDRDRSPDSPAGKGVTALGSPGARWVLSHTFGEGHRNAACEAVAIACRWDGLPFDAARREVFAWGRVHLPGYTDREMADVLRSNYRRDRPHGLSSRRLLELRGKDGLAMPSVAAVVSCAVTGGPPLRRRRPLSSRTNRPLLEEVARALEAVKCGMLRGTISSDEAAPMCGIKTSQFKKHVKPFLTALGLAATSKGRTSYGPTPNTYRRLSRGGLLRALVADSSLGAPKVVLRIQTLYRWLLLRVFGLVDALRSVLRALVHGSARGPLPCLLAPPAIVPLATEPLPEGMPP